MTAPLFDVLADLRKRALSLRAQLVEIGDTGTLVRRPRQHVFEAIDKTGDAIDAIEEAMVIVDFEAFLDRVGEDGAVTS